MDELLVGNGEDEDDVDSVDDVVGEAFLVDVVVGGVRVVAFHAVDDDNGSDDEDGARRALMHAKK